MGSLVFNPSNDFRNDGWSIVGGAGSVYGSVQSTSSDTFYISAPAGKGHAVVTFPIDEDSLPTGAVITSLTINVRSGNGLGTPPPSTPSSLTISVSPKDDSSKYLVRTIYPTGVPTDTIVASYSNDPLGQPWDVQRLNQLECHAFTYCGGDDDDDCVRVYKFYCTINYRVAPTVAITAPTGTVSSPTPTLSWTYSQTDGDPQAKTDYKIFTSVQQADPSFNPETTAPTFSATVQGDISSTILPTSINSNTYWLYLRSWSSFGAKSTWVGQQFSVSGPTPGTPGVDNPATGGTPGAGIIQTVPDGSVGCAYLSLRDTSNMLSPQMGDAEVAADGIEWITTNSSVAVDNTVAFPGGGYSWKLTTTTGGSDASITSSYVEISPAVPVTARAQFLPHTTARFSWVEINFYDAYFNFISATTGGSVMTTTGSWTSVSQVGTTPAGSAYARIMVGVSGSSTSEVHNIDHAGLMYGTQTPWSDGGSMSRNLLSAWYSNSQGSPSNGEGWTGGSGTTVGTSAPPGVGGDGTSCNTLTYVGISPSLGLRAAGTEFTSPTSGTNYTLWAPAGLATGDLMIAYVTSSNENATCTPPAGWTLVDTAAQLDGDSDDVAMYIMKRTAGASEPSSWTDGSLSNAALRRSAVVVAYTGAADASVQFIGEATASSANTGAYLTTPTVNNTDPNAWRASAFVVSDTASAGTLTANIVAPSGIPPIEYVGAATAWKTTSNSSSYSINKPSGIASGDLLIATIAYPGNGSVTAPTGWRITDEATGGSMVTAVMVRTAGSSEPTTWSGSVSGQFNGVKVVECVAYRNCLVASSQFVSSNMDYNDNATGRHTPYPYVTNSNSSAWRVCSFAAISDDPSSWTGGDTIERCDDSIGSGSGAVTISISDSNASVSTGNYYLEAWLSEGYTEATGWMGFLAPLTTPPSPGGGETSRSSGTAGSSNPWNVVNIFDSNGQIPAGLTSVTGAYSHSYSSAAGWIGIIRPATATVAGQILASMATTVDISSVSPVVMNLAGGEVAVTGSFMGSTGGTPYLTASFYRANQLINTLTAPGNSFGTSTWTKSSAVFPMPSGTTRMALQVSVSNRNISDVVYFDRVSLALGSDTTYRPGTYRPVHPIWAVPVLEYAEDDGEGYGPWTPMPGSFLNPPEYVPLSGATTYADHSVVPLTDRKYHAKTISYGLAGDMFVSPWGPDSAAFSFTAQNWWLKDITNPSGNIRLKVKFQTFSLTNQNTATQYQPVGTQYPVVLTEGFKTDTFTLDLIPVDQADYAALKAMLTSGKTLFLQSDIDSAWWVRPTSDLSVDLLASNMRQSNPIREIKVTFVEVAAPPSASS